MSTTRQPQPIRWNSRGRAVGFALQCLAGAFGFLTVLSALILVMGGQP